MLIDSDDKIEFRRLFRIKCTFMVSRLARGNNYRISPSFVTSWKERLNLAWPFNFHSIAFHERNRANRKLIKNSSERPHNQNHRRFDVRCRLKCPFYSNTFSCDGGWCVRRGSFDSWDDNARVMSRLNRFTFNVIIALTHRNPPSQLDHNKQKSFGWFTWS